MVPSPLLAAKAAVANPGGCLVVGSPGGGRRGDCPRPGAIEPGAPRPLTGGRGSEGTASPDVPSNAVLPAQLGGSRDRPRSRAAAPKAPLNMRDAARTSCPPCDDRVPETYHFGQQLQELSQQRGRHHKRRRGGTVKGSNKPAAGGDQAAHLRSRARQGVVLRLLLRLPGGPCCRRHVI